MPPKCFRDPEAQWSAEPGRHHHRHDHHRRHDHQRPRVVLSRLVRPELRPQQEVRRQVWVRQEDSVRSDRAPALNPVLRLRRRHHRHDHRRHHAVRLPSACGPAGLG